jgi:hypothetical protein
VIFLVKNAVVVIHLAGEVADLARRTQPRFTRCHYADIRSTQHVGNASVWWHGQSLTRAGDFDQKAACDRRVGIVRIGGWYSRRLRRLEVFTMHCPLRPVRRCPRAGIHETGRPAIIDMRALLYLTQQSRDIESFTRIAIIEMQTIIQMLGRLACSGSTKV